MDGWIDSRLLGDTPPYVAAVVFVFFFTISVARRWENEIMSSSAVAAGDMTSQPAPSLDRLHVDGLGKNKISAVNFFP